MNIRSFWAGGTGALMAAAAVTVAVGGSGAASAQSRVQAALVGPGVLSMGSASTGPAMVVSTTTSTTTTLPGQTTTTTTLPGQTTTTAVPTTTTTPPSTTTTTVPAAQVLADALVAVQAERGVEWRYVIAAGSQSITESVHAGLVDGTLTDAIHLAKSGTVTYNLHGRMYFRGTANGLAQDLHFKGQYAKAEAGKWLSASTQNAPFLDLASIMTMSAVTSMIDLPGGSPKEEARTTVRGSSVIPLEQNIKVSGVKIVQTVYIRAAGRALPVEIVREIDGVEGVITFSHWGQPPDAAVPKKSMPFSSKWVAST